MCDSSNRPHPVRTARCSLRMPVGYWTGMSQPAKSTMRAFKRRWTALSAVVSRTIVSEGEPITEDAGQERSDPRELFGEQQDAHADEQRAAEAFDGEHVRSNAT